MFRVFVYLIAALLVGCSKPETVVETPKVEIAAIEVLATATPEIKPTATPTPTATVSATATPPKFVPALPRTKTRIVSGLQDRKFVLEPLESSASVSGVSAYKIKDVPFAVVFTEEAGTLREIEAMSLAGMSDRYSEQMEDFGTMIGEVATGELRYTMTRIVEDVLRQVGRSSGSASVTFDGVRTELTRRDDGGYSFKFTAVPKPVSKSKPKADTELVKTKAEIMALLMGRGYNLERIEEPTPKPGVTRYRAKGDPVGVDFIEFDGKLRTVVALTIDDESENRGDMTVGLATTLCVELTGNTREDCRRELELQMDGIGSKPGSRLLVMGNGKKGDGLTWIDTIRHADGGYSFKFSSESNDEEGAALQ